MVQKADALLHPRPRPRRVGRPEPVKRAATGPQHRGAGDKTRDKMVEGFRLLKRLLRK